MSSLINSQLEGGQRKETLIFEIPLRHIIFLHYRVPIEETNSCTPISYIIKDLFLLFKKKHVN